MRLLHFWYNFCREKMLPHSSRLLPTRTGSSPLRKYVPPPSLLRNAKVSLFSDSFQHLPQSSHNLSQEPNELLTQKSTSSLPLYNPVVTNKICSKRGVRMTLPGSFLPPADQHHLAVEWIQSNQNMDFNPPMPRNFNRPVSAYNRRKGRE